MLSWIHTTRVHVDTGSVKQALVVEFVQVALPVWR